MGVLGIHHVALNVADVTAAIDFYTGRLGFTVRDDRPDVPVAGAWLQTGEQQLHLIEDATPPIRGPHVALLVSNLDELVAELRSSGVKVSEPIGVGPARQSFLRDPSGNGIELHERAG